jgi:hypothetical protein
VVALAVGGVGSCKKQRVRWWEKRWGRGAYCSQTCTPSV